jgi:hypothetical protein
MSAIHVGLGMKCLPGKPIGKEVLDWLALLILDRYNLLTGNADPKLDITNPVRHNTVPRDKVFQGVGLAVRPDFNPQDPVLG